MEYILKLNLIDDELQLETLLNFSIQFKKGRDENFFKKFIIYHYRYY